MIVDAQGTPLALHVTGANARDEQAVPQLLSDLAARGVRIGALHGDAGYGFPWTVAAVTAAGIEPVLSARGRPADAHGSGLGRVRRVVEQTLANLGHCRRVKVCYEKCGAHFLAFNLLAAALLCFKRLEHYTGGGL